ncbi:EscJ/YscJ/HrcJ family type III secretion inner membrane ring protein [Gammaproteobacteria bacterium 45_16_T64]|nr:EscJ/YscJ/HrcJ family type III secretion inner membrane ring protein [Gammaproteobacteria bacterium 45_16_T64]
MNVKQWQKAKTMVSGFQQTRRVGVVILLCLCVVGCKTELYTNLSEKEGNEMLSILLIKGIDAEKISQKKGSLVTLKVSNDDFSQAIGILKGEGLPRDEFASVGELFKKDGLISSPLEERVRYIYGLSQEISATLTQLDGVITARVHIVIPDAKGKNSPIATPSASVFIKYAESAKLDDFVPQIKMLVNNSIEGLDYDNITVALFPSQPLLTATQ